MELNDERLDRRLFALREEAKRGRDPTCADGTLFYLLDWVRGHRPRRILEIGTAEGLTACALLTACAAEYTGIECDRMRAARARENFETFGFAARATLLEGDAGLLLPKLGGTFDFIFLDGPKVQYRNYFPDLKRLLAPGGTLFSDDVLLYGWVRGEAPKKRHMLAEHLREYLLLLQTDGELETEILEIGEGLAVSRRREEGK